MTEQDPGAQYDTQKRLQEVVAGVIAAHSGDDADVVTQALARGIADAGIDEQPEKWLSDTAAEITEGRHVVVDRELGVGGGGN